MRGAGASSTGADGGCSSVRAVAPSGNAHYGGIHSGPCLMLRFAISSHRACNQVAPCRPRSQQVFVSMASVRLCLCLASVGVVRRLS